MMMAGERESDWIDRRLLLTHHTPHAHHTSPGVTVEYRCSLMSCVVQVEAIVIDR